MGGIKDAIFGSDAPEKAAEASVRGQEAGIAEQRRQFDILQEQLQPFRDIGLDAFRFQSLAAGQPFRAGPFGFQRQAPSPFTLGSDPLSEFSLGQGPTGTFELPQGEMPTDRGALGEDFNLTPAQEFLQQRAERALLRNAAATGQLGGGATQQALQEQAIGLGQQFLREQEEMDRSRRMFDRTLNQDEIQRLLAQEAVRAQREGVGMGRALTEEQVRAAREGRDIQNLLLEEQVRQQREGVDLGLQREELDLERQRQREIFNRLGAISGAGQVAQSQLGSAGMSTAQNIAQMQGNIGSLRGQGILGAAESEQQALGNLLGAGAGAGLGAMGALGPGIGAGGGALFALLSDRRLKKNINRIGKTKDGIPIYSYDYVNGYHVEAGVMADEVEKVFPEMVHELNGYKHIDIRFYYG